MLIQVAVAVIINSDDEIFISRRSAEQHQGNKWEFPGGKVETGETSQEALVREIKEELGIDVQSSSHLTDITHKYKNDIDSSHSIASKTVRLEVYEVRDWLGEPQGMEGQPTRWVKRAELAEIEFPAANKEIVDLLS